MSFMKKSGALLIVPMMLLGLSMGKANAEDKEAKAQAKELQKSITEVLEKEAKFASLLKALKEAELVETLNGPGPYTVFAPTDDAFKKLPPGTLDALLKDAPKLKKVLLYHVVPGNKPSKEVMTLSSVKTAHGTDLTIKVQDGKAMADNAQIVRTDIPTKNGTIHVIDTVLMPQVEVKPVK